MQIFSSLYFVLYKVIVSETWLKLTRLLKKLPSELSFTSLLFLSSPSTPCPPPSGQTLICGDCSAFTQEFRNWESAWALEALYVIAYETRILAERVRATLVIFRKWDGLLKLTDVCFWMYRQIENWLLMGKHLKSWKVLAHFSWKYSESLLEKDRNVLELYMWLASCSKFTSSLEQFTCVKVLREALKLPAFSILRNFLLGIRLLTCIILGGWKSTMKIFLLLIISYHTL